MRLKKFRPENLEEVNVWHSLRKMGALRKDMVPNIGYYVPGIAAGFIYRTDSCMAFLDGFISNPLTDKAEREIALDKITEALLDSADRLGYHIVLAMTQNDKIRERCKKYKFVPKGEHSLYMRGV
jgi:hypothetical protein